MTQFSRWFLYGIHLGLKLLILGMQVGKTSWFQHITCLPPSSFARNNGNMFFVVGNLALSSTNEEAHDRFGIVDLLVKDVDVDPLF